MSVREEIAYSEPLVRTLSLADLPAILEIERSSFSTPWRETTFEGLLLRRDTDLIGLTRVGRLLGYAISWTVGDQAELGNVAVLESERGQGFGKTLVDASLRLVQARGAQEVFLEVRESNTSARDLYEKCRFRVVGRRKNYYAKPLEDALVMRRDLG